ncbi:MULTISPECIES: histidine kinase [unclassified Microbacterium]|uniref:sensor histidine kinase n=1 Tax=unclassified Microbacterium TaxID=2609290 RepID=UPI00214AA7E0|nr:MULTISPECIES: histidine kinase [unclassified Microbacterium]MCR2783515.1 histidine kinase [Microbacterium sp. zg.B96]MDL5351697.1 histidine kinase [Microbacterium sp. zg-YB36]WIM15623.1 histidine kinase [Microbacterium sp. zg-B96]
MELPFWAWCTVAAFCAALFTAAVPVTTAVYDVPLLAAFAICTAQSGSLILTIFRPLVGTAAQLAAIVALALATRGVPEQPWPLPVTGLISLGALILLVGIRERWIVSLTVWWVSIVVLVAVIAASPTQYASPDQWGANLIIYSSYTVTVLAAAIAVGQRARIRSDLARARRDIELEQAQRLYVEERARIARELHDVVAHSMSIIHMQAISAPFRLRDAAPAAIEEEFSDIARSARAALSEMRQLLGALRSGDDDADLLPQPQLTELSELTQSASRAGTDVELVIDPRAYSSSSLVQLTAYRIVQEALSNIVRHAAGAPTTVRVSVDEESVLIVVRNARSGHATGAAPGGPIVDRGGEGLRGMRERVSLLGGHLSTGPTPDGGYLVDAALPAAIESRLEAP